MRKYLAALAALLLFSSHDLFLKLDRYHLPPDTAVTLRLFNGSFGTSENVIDRDRMLDVSVLGNGERTRIDTTQWREADHATLLDLVTGNPGTYVAGVSTRARNIDLAAEKFNSYLEHDGVLDMLERRRSEGTLDRDATERYAKHVKTLFQVGDRTTDDYRTPLGYPIEFVPLDNPYTTHAGHDLRVQLLWRGEPLAGQLVHLGSNTGHDHDHAHDADGNHPDVAHDHQHGTQPLRTNLDGIVTIRPNAAGTWYLRTIYMVESEEPGLTHESEWATLTFGVSGGDHDHGHAHHSGHDHDHGHAHHDDHDHGHSGTHTHADGTEHAHHGDHDHNHEGGLPGYVWWIGSLLVIGGLFFFFNRRG